MNSLGPLSQKLSTGKTSHRSLTPERALDRNRIRRNHQHRIHCRQQLQRESAHRSWHRKQSSHSSIGLMKQPQLEILTSRRTMPLFQRLFSILSGLTHRPLRVRSTTHPLLPSHLQIPMLPLSMLQGLTRQPQRKPHRLTSRLLAKLTLPQRRSSGKKRLKRRPLTTRLSHKSLAKPRPGSRLRRCHMTLLPCLLLGRLYHLPLQGGVLLLCLTIRPSSHHLGTSSLLHPHGAITHSGRGRSPMDRRSSNLHTALMPPFHLCHSHNPLCLGPTSPFRRLQQSHRRTITNTTQGHHRHRPYMRQHPRHTHLHRPSWAPTILFPGPLLGPLS